MNTFIILTSLFVISSIFSYVNARWIKLPGVIGVMVLAIITALVTMFAGKTFPIFSKYILDLSSSIDFSKTLLDILLGFLLFASALHSDINKLKQNLRGVLIISTVGVLISTFLFAGMLFYILNLFGLDFPFIYCLLFGALISPTDAIAVAALLKNSKMPTRLETIISGESLLNDGIGIVLFVTFLELANTPDVGFSLSHSALLFAKEVFGGLFLGAALGWVAYRMIRTINDFQTIVLISISLVMAISVLAGLLHVSIPLAAVAAGLLLGSVPFNNKPGSLTNEYLGRIWKLIDDLLNTILFVLIGLQMVSVSITTKNYLWISAITIVILLIARLLSIALPIILQRRTLRIHYNSIFILTWGGLRGGISVALALSLPPSEYRELILTAGFFIVVFSVIIQGLTLNSVVNWFVKKGDAN